MSESILAVAVVADCSLALLHEWDYILNHYLFHILQRLHESTQGPNQQCRLAFITYGAANTRPSPIVHKLFFTPFQVLLKELSHDPRKFGLGSVASGGGKGAAVLEALVAATEMFDLLSSTLASNHDRKPLHPQSLNQSPPKQDKALPTISARHIIHIAALPPDGAKRPLRNESPSLDGTTWSTLPDELKERDIKWSAILLPQSSTRLMELHSKVEAGDKVAPWFPTQSKHSLLLVGIPPRAPKRPGDAPTTPEPKRPRLSSSGTQGSPSVANASPPKVAPTTPSIAPKAVPAPAPPPDTQPQSQPRQPPRPMTMSVEQVDERLRTMERDLTMIRARLPALEQEKPQDLSAARMLLQQKLMQYTQLKALQKALKERQMRMDAQPPMQMQNSNHNQGNGLPMGVHLMQGQNLMQQQQPQQPAMEVDGIQAQMQKLLEQRQQQQQQQQQRQQQQQQQQQSSQGQGNQGPAGFPPGMENAPVQWHGNFTWPSQQGDVFAEVDIKAQANLTPEFWPTSLKLKPMPMPAKSDMQEYLKGIGPVVCMILPCEPVTNKNRFVMFTQLMLQKNAFSLASWTHPLDSSQTLNFLLISLPAQVFGAFFRSAGEPNIPKPKPLIDLAKLPRHVLARLAQMGAEERARFLRDLAVQQQAMRRKMQEGQAGGMGMGMGMGNPNPNPNPNLNAGLFTGMGNNGNMPGFMGGMQGLPVNLGGGPGNAQGGLGFNPAMALAQGQGQAQQNFNMMQAMAMGMGMSGGGMMPQQQQQQGGGNGNVNMNMNMGFGGNSMGNVSMAMLQSFMQRNAQGGGGAGPAGGG